MLSDLHAAQYAILSNNLIFLIKRPQINPVIHYPLPLPTGNYMRLPDHCPYNDYSHISTIGLLADLYMSASAVKSTSTDRIKYTSQCQAMDISILAHDISYLKEC